MALLRLQIIAILLGLLAGACSGDGPGAADGPPHAAYPRSPHAWLCHGHRVARWQQSSGECGRKLHHRAHSPARRLRCPCTKACRKARCMSSP